MCIAVLTGNWLAWSPWTDCTVTCDGGVRARSRECDGGTADLKCVGDESQNLECEKWRCPGKSIVLTDEH